MVREKIKISKIEKAAARQATFSKRRRGLFKKAQELAILCDVDVGVIVFSAKGKLYEFSSISMDGIIRKYRLNPNDGIYKSGHPCLKMQLKNTRHESLGNELLETGLQLRQLNGEDIEGLTQNELIHLEKMLENGLSLVLDRKGEKVMEEIRGLQNKVAKLMEENELLRNQVMELSKDKEQVAFGVPGRIWLDNRQSSVSVNITSNSRNGRESVNREDTSLKLGLPFN